MLYYIMIIVILAIVIILASILVIPFHISLKLSNNGLEYNGYFKVSWMRIRILKKDIPSKEEKPAEEKKEKPKKDKSQWNLERILRVLNLILDALPHLERIFYAFLKSFSLERFQLDLILGLDSPVDTAQISGIFWSILPIMNIIPKVSISMRPDFIETTFKGQIELELKLKLLGIVSESLRALTKKPVRNFIREVRA